MPRNVLGRELGLCPELSTATARWRPTEASGLRGSGRRSPARRGVGGEELGHDAWVPREAAGEAGSGLRPPSVASGGAPRRRQRETEKQRGGR